MHFQGPEALNQLINDLGFNMNDIYRKPVEGPSLNNDNVPRIKIMRIDEFQLSLSLLKGLLSVRSETIYLQ